MNELEALGSAMLEISEELGENSVFGESTLREG